MYIGIEVIPILFCPAFSFSLFLLQREVREEVQPLVLLKAAYSQLF